MGGRSYSVVPCVPRTIKIPVSEQVGRKSSRYIETRKRHLATVDFCHASGSWRTRKGRAMGSRPIKLFTNNGRCIVPTWKDYFIRWLAQKIEKVLRRLWIKI